MASSAERRALVAGDKAATVRVVDLFASTPAVTGKVELVYKGEQEGPGNVAQFLIGRAVKDAFNRRFIPNYKPDREQKFGFPKFKGVVEWFEDNHSLDLTDDMGHDDYLKALKAVAGLEKLAKAELKPEDPRDLGAAMEFLVDGLAQNYLITKSQVSSGKIVYSDTVSHMMGQMEEE